MLWLHRKFAGVPARFPAEWRKSCRFGKKNQISAEKFKISLLNSLLQGTCRGRKAERPVDVKDKGFLARLPEVKKREYSGSYDGQEYQDTCD